MRENFDGNGSAGQGEYSTGVYGIKNMYLH